jgi:hypothetical protein
MGLELLSATTQHYASALKEALPAKTIALRGGWASLAERGLTLTLGISESLLGV